MDPWLSQNAMTALLGVLDQANDNQANVPKW
jgi:hypothetical protein